MLKDWNFWCSILTALTAILALGFSVHQIRLSNKQHLFERRLKVYMLANGIISLCKDNYMWISAKRKETPQYANDLVVIWLTNNTYMEELADAIEHPLEQPFHKEFLRKREELRNTAMEIELIFKGEVASRYANFLRVYAETLAMMYRYQIVINKMNKEKEKRPMTIEESENLFHEKKYREERYNAIDKLKVAYDAVAEDKIQKQMRKQLALM